MEQDQVIKAFSALSQETRLQIYKLLVDHGDIGLPAGDIAMILGVPQNTLSFHLSHLERADLVISRRAGRYIIYRAVPDTMKNLLGYMVDYCCPADIRKKA